MQKELQTKHLEISEISVDELSNQMKHDSGINIKYIPMLQYKKTDKLVLSYPTKLIEINLNELNEEVEIELNEILQQNGKADET